MAKGVPIQGKDPLGKAKYANVTESGDLRVQLSGTKVELETALNAVSIAPGTTQKFTLNQGDADEVWFLVSADKPGWELLGGVAYSKSVSQGNRSIFYPNGATGGTAGLYTPKRFLVLGCMSPLEDPTTYLEARAMMTPVAAGTEFGVYVRPTEGITTITLKVLKIWRR